MTTDTPPADAEVAEPLPELLAETLTLADQAAASLGPDHVERRLAEVTKPLNSVTIDGPAAFPAAFVREPTREQLADNNARLRERAAAAEERRDEALASNGEYARILERTRRERDADRARYTRLVGEVERIAADVDSSIESAKRLERLGDDDPPTWAEHIRTRTVLARRLRALAATAPQTAPARPTARCEYTDRDLSTGRPLRCEQPAHDGRMHRLVFADAPSEPTAADPEPVRVTAGTEATAIVRKHLDPLVSPVGIGSTYTFHAGLPEVLTGRIVTDLLTAGLLDASHPAGDEHLQALRGDWDALLIRIAEALGIAPKLAALVDESTIVDEAARVRRERDEARELVARLHDESGQRAIRTAQRHDQLAAEATLADMEERIEARNKEIDDLRYEAAGARREAERLRLVLEEERGIDVTDRLRALDAGSDTTGDTP